MSAPNVSAVVEDYGYSLVFQDENFVTRPYAIGSRPVTVPSPTSKEARDLVKRFEGDYPGFGYNFVPNTVPAPGH